MLILNYGWPVAVVVAVVVAVIHQEDFRLYGMTDMAVVVAGVAN
jgi:hypothetical protein